MKILKFDKRLLNQYLKVNKSLRLKHTIPNEYLYIKSLISILYKNSGLIKYNNLGFNVFGSQNHLYSILENYVIKEIEISYFNYIENKNDILLALGFIPSFKDAYVLNIKESLNDVYITFGLSINKHIHNNKAIHQLNRNYRYSHNKKLLFTLCFVNYQKISGVVHNDYVAHMVGGHNKLNKLPIKEIDNLLYLDFFTNSGAEMSFSCGSIVFIKQEKSMIK